MSLICLLQWFEVLDGLLGKYWRNVGLAFNCTFLLFGSVIQLIACARYLPPIQKDVTLALTLSSYIYIYIYIYIKFLFN